MGDIAEEEIKEQFKCWQPKRKPTFCVYCFAYLLNGVQTACLNATAWIYVTRQIVTNEPYLMFGFLNGLIYLVSILLNPFILILGINTVVQG